MVGNGGLCVRTLLFAIAVGSCFGTCAAATPKVVPLQLAATDVVPTGNQWITLPDIRASDGALGTFNVLSMRHRGLLQVAGVNGEPVILPTFAADGKPLLLHNPQWELVEYWTPVARQSIDGLDLTLTWCAPPDTRGAFLRLTLSNHRTVPVKADLGAQASWGSLSRVTYTPVPLKGTFSAGPAPWVPDGEDFSYSTADTDFAWSLLHTGAQATLTLPPNNVLVPTVNAVKTATLAPGQTLEALFIVSAGIEEFSAAHNGKALRERLDREGADALIDQTAEWDARHLRTTGDPKLDLVMNRNYLFTLYYAWGYTLDTEQFIGVTARSPRYYVSSAYWDRDAMLWSFPALLDIDRDTAREALEYALTTQLRNTGTHSRFIDGVVLEDGFQLDEADAPIIALASFLTQTGDTAFLAAHRVALDTLRLKLETRYVPSVGLYSSLQDSQDEYQKRPYLTFDNVLTWRALREMAGLYQRLHENDIAAALNTRATELHASILTHCVAAGAEGAGGPIFVASTDGTSPLFAEIPPGSLMRLPALGFVTEQDPVFRRTYDWLHSARYAYSFSGQPFGLPGSYRVPSTTAWAVADHLLLKAGSAQAMKVLRESPWDGGIVSEGLDPANARVFSGNAFATAAGYVAHTICQVACLDRKPLSGTKER